MYCDSRNNATPVLQKPKHGGNKNEDYHHRCRLFAVLTHHPNNVGPGQRRYRPVHGGLRQRARHVHRRMPRRWPMYQPMQFSTRPMRFQVQPVGNQRSSTQRQPLGGLAREGERPRGGWSLNDRYPIKDVTGQPVKIVGVVVGKQKQCR